MHNTKLQTISATELHHSMGHYWEGPRFLLTLRSFSRHESVQPEAGRATYPTLSRCAGAVELAVVLWSRGAVPGARIASKTAAAAVRIANVSVA